MNSIYSWPGVLTTLGMWGFAIWFGAYGLEVWARAIGCGWTKGVHKALKEQEEERAEAQRKAKRVEDQEERLRSRGWEFSHGVWSKRNHYVSFERALEFEAHFDEVVK